jgi:hypothetical protein
MTETATTSPEPTALPPHPADVLLSLIVALLAPMFLGVTAGHIGLARLAALETINAYQARNHADLIAIAQIIAYGLAALGSLSLSMADDISLNMTLRLRGNANACTRSAEHNRRALNQSHRDPDHAGYAMSETEMPPVDENFTEAVVIAGLEAARKLAVEVQTRLQAAEPVQAPIPQPPTIQPPIPQPTIAAPVITPAPTGPLTPAEQQKQMIWANSMLEVAGEFTASIRNLPPSQRQAASVRAAALTSTANALMSGRRLPPQAPLAVPR